MTRKKHSFFYNWGSVTTIFPDIRTQELAARATWFIKMRWLAILACAAGALIAVTGIVPADVNPVDFLITIAFLSLTNLIYTKIGRNLFGDKTRSRELQRLLLWQMFGDFTALSFLTYSLGCIETPMGALFMAHIILATLLFSRWRSLMIAAAGWVYASAPLLLELAGIIPVNSIFKSEFREAVSHDPGITLGFVLASGMVYLFCWYLVSEISSSLKLRERQLEDAHQMLIRIDREKTQSTLLATHELKAPFAAIKSYVYTLRDGYCGELPEKARAVVTRIGKRCDQITDRITDIIHLSNLRTLVVTEMNLVPVNLISLLCEEAGEGSLIGKSRNIKIINLVENRAPIYIMGSYDHLKTLFSNLIQNAINYSPDNTGRVVISVETSPGKAEVAVQDNGIGIPKDALDKIFNDHFRSKNAVAHHAGGTGLGLSIVKEIVVLHGASIQVESIVGRGSSFTVRFDTIEATQEKK
ncbi:MAG: HAMP domain-containing histidine kinase [Acidobacteria bacterium]|nr:HAMP domain-containing histidine kinase [Acidobacteriota bacterium]